MSDEDLPPDSEQDPLEERSGTVLVFRNQHGEPIAVPDEVVTAGERAYRAYQEHLSGKSWDQIAIEEQYPSASAVRYDVQRYMDEAQALVVERSARQLLQLEVARMDALQAAVWPQALRGHVQSAALALNIIIQRAKLVGLDPEKMNDADTKAHTVVVPSQSDGYIDAMKRAAGEAP